LPASSCSWSLGKDPVKALYSFFIEPLTEVWSLHELAIKAAPLILIAVGLSVCYRSNNWNIGAEGQFIIGAMAGSVLPVVFHGWQSPPGAAADAGLRHDRRGGLCGDPGIPESAAQHQRDPHQPDAGLCRATACSTGRCAGHGAIPKASTFPKPAILHDYAVLPRIIETGKTHWGFGFALIAALVFWFIMRRTLKGFEISVLGESARAGRFAGFSDKKMVYFAFLDLGRAGRPCRHIGSVGRHRPAPSGDFARLRLHGHHRGVPGTAQSAGHRRGRPHSGADLSRRRGGTDLDWHHRQGDATVPGAVAVLRAGMRHVDPLPHPAGLRAAQRGSTA
jgi:hypothetical protein